MHRQSSADKFESLLRLHVYPLLGERRLAAVRPSGIQAWVKRLLVEHRLAPWTVPVVHGVLASVFKSAVRDRIVSASPCEGTWSVATRPAGPGSRSCSWCSRPRGASR